MIDWFFPYWSPPIHWFIAGGVRFSHNGSDYLGPSGQVYDGLEEITDAGTFWLSADVLMPTLTSGWLWGLCAWIVPSLLFVMLRVLRRGFLLS